jgi:spermidine synthase
MIEAPASAPPRAPAPPLELPVGRRPARALLLVAVLAVAACGFAYELTLITLGTYLLGSSVAQVSAVLAAFVSSMGLGSLLAKPLLRRAVTAFIAVESAVALLGGTSGLVLFAAFAWLDLFEGATIVAAGAIGALVGCEIPLLLSLMQRVRREDAGSSVADLLAADYLGAVLAGLALPFLVVPFLGQIEGALAVGAVNALAGLLVLWLFARSLPRRAAHGLLALGVGVLALLGVAANFAGRFEVSARQALYDDPIAHAERTPYQEVVITHAPATGDLRLFLNGDLQFSSVDEYRYHEALVHPALAGPRESVLVLGGGDGLALREVLRYPDVRRVVLVELDPRMSELGRNDERLRSLNGGALRDPRVEVVTADAFSWLRAGPRERFDAAVLDFPDPDDPALAKLYSIEMYAMVRRRALRPGGRAVIQAGSPYFAPEAFWSIRASAEAAGLATRAFHVDVPSFGDWGYVLGRAGRPPDLELDPPGRLRFLDSETLAAAAVFPPDRGPLPVEPSTLNRPVIVEYERRGWHDY